MRLIAMSLRSVLPWLLDGQRSLRLMPRVALLATFLSMGMVGVPSFAQSNGATERTVNEWLTRMHTASQQRSYSGTLVVSTGSAMSASRIWHVCDGKHQMERIETLTGAPRTTIRHNDEVITFVPDEKIAWVEKRESLGLFPELLRTPINQIPSFYGVRERGVERVAGYASDVVDIVPKDTLRFGYRIWSEKRSGLVVKLQTVDKNGQVLEQLAFSELQMSSPVGMSKLARMMNDTRGYDVRRPASKKIAKELQGWQLDEAIPGFFQLSCHARVPESSKEVDSQAVQCVYSDGLASVSLFIEPIGSKGSIDEAFTSMGATHSLTRQIGGFWFTAMGEVPAETLMLFAGALASTR